MSCGGDTDATWNDPCADDSAENHTFLWVAVAVLFGILLIYVLFDQPQRIVTPGRYTIIDALTVCSLAGRCFYQNVDTPYGIFLTPDPTVQTADFLFGGFKLTITEAVVLMGYPPPSTYYAYIPYLLRKGTQANPVFQSLSDGIGSGFTPIPAGKQVAVIATRNRAVFELEAQYLLSLPKELFDGVIYPLYFTDVVGDADTLSLLSRATLFNNDTTDIPAYRANPRMIGYKVQYPAAGTTLVPISLQGENLKPNGIKLKTLSTTPSEIPLGPAFKAYADEQAAEMVVDTAAQLIPFLADEIGVPYNNGYQCTAAGVGCFGDNRQAYYASYGPFAATAGQQIVVAAINHAAFGRAIYVQISLYNDETEFGIESSREFPNGPLFYTVMFDAPYTGEFRLIERAYADPGNGVAPDANSVIPAYFYVGS